MKKIITVIMLVIFGALFTACNKTETASDKPQIYTSFYALYDFANEISGDYADVYNMVPPGTEPHDWEPTVQDMAKLNNADVVLYNGLGMESWIDKVKSSIGEGNVNFTEVSAGVAVDEDGSDPHIWLNPDNVKIMCRNIYNVLCEVDPENKAYYEENYNNYAAELSSLDKKYSDALSGFDNKNIVVSHEAYSYMCSAYGLTQTAIDGISADSEPSPEKMMELINFVKSNNIKYIFYEELVSKKTAETLAGETGTELLPLNPFEGLSDEEIEAGENYISVMEKNLENIKTALMN